MQIFFAYMPVPESSPKHIHTRANWGQKAKEKGPNSGGRRTERRSEGRG